MKSVALIGYGYWGPNFARIINESNDADLTWCCDTSEESLLKIKNRFPYIKTTTRLEDVLEDKDVSAVVIVVPAKYHYEIAKKALLAGKDVLVEKPMTSVLTQAKDLMNIAKKKNKILMTDHIFLFNQAVAKIKRMIKGKELGKIYYGHGAYTALGPIRIDVSAMWDLSIHFLYTFSYLLGRLPTSISAIGRAYLMPNNPDVAFLNLEYGKDTVFNLKVSWIDPAKNRSLVLVGDKKMVVFDDNQTDKITVFDRGVLWEKQKSIPNRFTFRYGDITLPHISNKEPLLEAFNEFIRSVKSRRQPSITMEDAVNIVAILEAAQHSLNNSGKTIPLKMDKKTGLLTYKL